VDFLTPTDDDPLSMRLDMATAFQNGAGDGGINGADYGATVRFSDIPKTIDIPFRDQPSELVEIMLKDTEAEELASVLATELAERKLWMVAAMYYAKHNEIDSAIDILTKASEVLRSSDARSRVSLACALCWLYLQKTRQAPRVVPDGPSGSEARTKEHYLQQATAALNDASRINPSFPPLVMARGVLQLLKASLVVPSASSGTNSAHAERAELLRQALKAFEDVLSRSAGKNMLAMMGRARTLYSMNKINEALDAYQQVLQAKPDLVDPDPRIGIGCCFWHAGHKNDARASWERALELNPDNKHAHVLLGMYYLDTSGSVPANSPQFLELYGKAMGDCIVQSFKLDTNLPMTCAAFSTFFLAKKELDRAVTLAHKAIDYTDVNSIASDGWYLLARKEHAEGNLAEASHYYRRADDARGGAEKGYLPAKFGAAQIAVLRNDLGEAKLQLEKMAQQSKTYEGQFLLGTLYAEEVFGNMTADVKEDKSKEQEKATKLLEAVRTSWKDHRKILAPDAAVSINLARLYEAEHPEKALQCLQQAEELQLELVPRHERPTDTKDEAEVQAALRKFLPPQLLNNIGCFYSQAEKHSLASEMFQAALSSCVRIAGAAEEEVPDTDALITTITFNLGRSYECQGMTDKATEAYEKLLSRHSDYTDARTRLAYIKLRQKPHKDGPDAVARLYQEYSADPEVRALYGWYLGKVSRKKMSSSLNDDPEFKHFKHTLQTYDKHDRYALVGIGNLYLKQAREMRRTTESEKAKRSAMYVKAVEFFDKALLLDPKCAYAAMGIAIALAEERKDLAGALSIFIKVRETVKDHIVFVNLGHIFSDLGQFSKAIESYRAALQKEGKEHDSLILSCLGRTYLRKARVEKSIDSYLSSLDCAEKVWTKLFRRGRRLRSKLTSCPTGSFCCPGPGPLQVQ
jgi:RNA polymerase-associated protein CTR9